MFNNNLVILIGLLIILSVLFERFTKSSLLNERFLNETDTVNKDTDPGPKYNSDKTSYVDYSADFSNFKLKLSNGFFKIKSLDDSYTSYTGKITIQFTKNDYREAPFDNSDNIINCFRKWQYFKHNDGVYRMTIPKDKTEIDVSKKDAPPPPPPPPPAPPPGRCERQGTNVKDCKSKTDKGACTSEKDWLGQTACKWIEGFQNKNNIVENFQNNIITLVFEFKSIVENQPIEFTDELVLSELIFYTGPYGNNTFTDKTSTSFASGLLGKLGEVNNGVTCGWHYNKETGEAAGYFSDILNDKEWQKDYPELYNSLSKYICPSYLPVCTGQRNSGIVPGKCITLKDDCNNNIVDDMMGLPKRTYASTRIVDPYEIKYKSIIDKNIANKKILRTTIKKLTDALDNPTIETFENAEDSKTSCKFNIENKCYDHYLVVDKNYYDTGADIFNNMFPLTDPNIFKQKCYDVTHWISKNIVSLLFYKLIVGGFAGILYWSLNPHLDYQIRIFKSFIAFVFCEIYILYNVYKHILKPTFVERTQMMA
jgi:hypothetical protein